MFRKTWFRAALVLTILASLVVAPLFVSAQMENGITSPADGATISGTVTVTGYADDPNFLRWDLFVFPGGSDSGKLWVASGNTAGEFSVDLDTTKYPDGEHALGLRVVTNPRQNYSEYVTPITIANAEAPAAEPAAPAAAAAPAAPAAPAAAPVTVTSVTLPVEAATVAGTVAVSGSSSEDGARWELLLFPNGNVQDSNKVWLAGATGGGDFSYDLDTTKYPDGTHSLVVRTVRADSNYTDSVSPVTFANADAPAAAPAPAAPVEEEVEAPAAAAPAPAPAPVATANGLALTDGATVSGTVEVTGYADDPNFRRWDLFIFPGGNESAKIWVASGSTPGEFSVTLDTTQFPNGEHVFSLRVVTNPSQNYSEYLTPFVVANPE